MVLFVHFAVSCYLIIIVAYWIFVSLFNKDILPHHHTFNHTDSMPLTREKLVVPKEGGIILEQCRKNKLKLILLL